MDVRILNWTRYKIWNSPTTLIMPYSFLNISLNNLSMGTVPIVFLKNSSSISFALIRLKVGRRRRRRPNRASWVGHWARTYSPSMSCAWSWVDSTCSGSLSPHAAERSIACRLSGIDCRKGKQFLFQIPLPLYITTFFYFELKIVSIKLTENLVLNKHVFTYSA